MIYINKYDYSGKQRGERKKAETENGRQLLRYAVKKEWGLDTELMHILCKDYGKPFFQDVSGVEFNISHSGDYVAVMLADTPVGVDIQTVRSVKERVINKVCNDYEKKFVFDSEDINRAFIRLWTLKESYVKAIGRGMTFSMSNVNFDVKNYSDEFFGKFSNRSGVFFTKDFGSYILSACVLSEDIPNERLEKIFKIDNLCNNSKII